jgi:hypothetical protein
MFDGFIPARGRRRLVPPEGGARGPEIFDYYRRRKGMRRIGLLVAAIAFVTTAVIGGMAAAQEKEKGGRPLTTALTGAAEVPGPGDPDGKGTAVITLNQGQKEVCFELTVENIGHARAHPLGRGGRRRPPGRDHDAADGRLVERLRQRGRRPD